MSEPGPYEDHQCGHCDHTEMHPLLLEQHYAREHAPTLEEIRRRAMRRV